MDDRRVPKLVDNIGRPKSSEIENWSSEGTPSRGGRRTFGREKTPGSSDDFVLHSFLVTVEKWVRYRESDQGGKTTGNITNYGIEISKRAHFLC